jgi:hypothetical protein
MDGMDIALHYNMDEEQTQAYQICLIWLETSKKVFPDYKHYRMPKKGDPRKSLLFKYCYKLVRETKGIIPIGEYPLYVRAQLDILKAITDGKQHPMVDPNILTGNKAWVRWLIWKKKYDQKVKAIKEKIDTPIHKIKQELENTRAHLVKHFHGLPTLGQMQQALDNKNLFRWIAGKQLSPYYLVLSPFILKLFPEYEGLETNTDLDVYREQINVEVAEVFEQIFPNEL